MVRGTSLGEKDIIDLGQLRRYKDKIQRVTMLLQSVISALLVFILPVSAQFDFFNMFNQGRQQQQQPQNAGSDSSWYQQRYEDGKNHSVAFDMKFGF